MGPVHVLATAKHGELQLPELLINLPGVRIEARGQGSKERLAFRGKLVARELKAFSRTLGKLVGPEALSVKGRGRLDFAIAGSVEHPSVTADGRFPLLAYQKSRVDGLALHLSVPDLKAPTGVKARVTARTLALAPRRVFRAVHLELDGKGQELTLDAAVHGYAELSLRAVGMLSPDRRGGRLMALSLRYPEAQWALDAPVQIESRAGLLVVSPLTLRSREEAISARVFKRGTKLDASLDLRSLDLGRLPRAFVDPALALGGVLDLRVRVRGPSSNPEAEARVHLRGGRFKSYRDVQLHLDASYAKDEVKGTLAANGAGIRLTGAFDVPVKALQQGRHVPVKVEFQMAELRLDESLRELGLEKPVSGLVSAQLSLRGTADDPRLEVAFKGRRLQVKQLAPLDIDVVAESADGGRLEARADLKMEGKKSFIELKTPFTLGQILRKPPDRAALMEAELALEVDVREAPLKLLSEAGMSSRPLDGALSARAHVTGTAMSPRGEVSVSGHGLATQGVKPLDALIRVQLGDELHADVRAERGRESIFTAKARVRADPRQLQDTNRLAQTPLSLEANLGPLSLSELQTATQPTDVDPAQTPPKIRGTLMGRLALSGTLHDPQLVLRTRVDGLGAESTPDGQRRGRLRVRELEGDAGPLAEVAEQRRAARRGDRACRPLLSRRDSDAAARHRTGRRDTRGEGLRPGVPFEPDWRGGEAGRTAVRGCPCERDDALAQSEWSARVEGWPTLHARERRLHEYSPAGNRAQRSHRARGADRQERKRHGEALGAGHADRKQDVQASRRGRPEQVPGDVPGAGHRGAVGPEHGGWRCLSHRRDHQEARHPRSARIPPRRTRKGCAEAGRPSGRRLDPQREAGPGHEDEGASGSERRDGCGCLRGCRDWIGWLRACQDAAHHRGECSEEPVDSGQRHQHGDRALGRFSNRVRQRAENLRRRERPPGAARRVRAALRLAARVEGVLHRAGDGAGHECHRELRERDRAGDGTPQGTRRAHEVAAAGDLGAAASGDGDLHAARDGPHVSATRDRERRRPRERPLRSWALSRPPSSRRRCPATFRSTSFPSRRETAASQARS